MLSSFYGGSERLSNRQKSHSSSRILLGVRHEGRCFTLLLETALVLSGFITLRMYCTCQAHSAERGTSLPPYGVRVIRPPFQLRNSGSGTCSNLPEALSRVAEPGFELALTPKLSTRWCQGPCC